jgi:hypothetical protein
MTIFLIALGGFLVADALALKYGAESRPEFDERGGSTRGRAL